MATSADWNAWLQQGQNTQRDPLAPLNQQFGGGHATAGGSTPYMQAGANDPASSRAWTGAPAQGDGQVSATLPDWNSWHQQPANGGQVEKLPFQNLSYAMDSGGSGNASSQSLPGGPPPTSPTGLTSGNPNQNGVGQQSLTAGVMPKIADSNLAWQNTAATGGSDWYNKIPEWTLGGGYPIGFQWNESTKTWTPKGPQAAGTLIGDEVGWHTGLYLPSAYNPASDTSAFETATGPERANARAIRQTADYVRTHPGTNGQHYFEYILANLTRDATAQGRSTGYDPRQFATTAYGEAYNPQKTYMAKGVSNPWTGKQAGNATGQDTSQPNLLTGSDTNSKPPDVPGTVPSPVPAPTPTPAPTPVPTTTTGGGGSDGKNPFLDEASIDMVRSNADQALSAIRGLRGGRDKSGPLGKYREDVMSRALQAYLSMNAGGNLSDPMSYANGGANELINRLNSGQGVGNYLRDNAGKMMNGLDYSNLDSGQIMDMLNLAGGAATFGYSPMGKYGMENTLADLQDQANIQGQRGINPTQSVLATRQGRGQFDDLLARFLAMQQGR